MGPTNEGVPTPAGRRDGEGRRWEGALSSGYDDPMTTSPASRPTRPWSRSTLAYGGDWNPEQWDEATVEADIAMMREAGVNLVSLGIFSWARLEPSEGVYDLDWLGLLIDRLHDAGIEVDLATGTASPPAWMACDHPDTLPVTAEGVRLGFGSRQQYCPSSRVYRERSAALARVLAQQFGEHEGVVMWHIGNEYGCHVQECFCDHCAAAFRVWLRNRHRNLDGLNAAWGTDFWSQRYTSWEQVQPPRAMPTFPNPGQVLDWRRFCDNQVRACMEGEIEAIRPHSTLPVTTNFMGSFPPLDYRRWARDLDVISDDHYPDPADPGAAAAVAWQGDLMRGLAGGAPWLLMEQAPSAVQWRTRNSPKRPGQFLLWTLERLAHGADGILQFQWRQSRQGSETFHSGMVPHAGRDSAVWDDVVETGRVLSRLTPLVGTRVSADVAVVMDWDSQWARSSACGPVEAPAPFAAAMAWHRSLWEAGYATDVIGPEDSLEGYRLVVVPELFIDHPALAASLEAVARGGVQVLVTGPTGVVDDTLGAVLGGYLGSLRPLLGVRVVDHAALTGAVAPGGRGVPLTEDPAVAARESRVQRLSRAVGVPAAGTWMGLEALDPALERALDRLGTPAPDLRGGMWAEVLAPEGTIEGWPEDVEVVAAFDGRGGGADLAGRPALTHRRTGAGGAWYAATDLDAPSRAALLGVLAAHARVHPVMADLPDGVEAARRGPFLFLLNHGDAAVELAGILGTDLVSGASCTGHVVIAPRSGMVVDTTPA